MGIIGNFKGYIGKVQDNNEIKRKENIRKEVQERRRIRAEARDSKQRIKELLQYQRDKEIIYQEKKLRSRIQPNTLEKLSSFSSGMSEGIDDTLIDVRPKKYKNKEGLI